MNATQEAPKIDEEVVSILRAYPEKHSHMASADGSSWSYIFHNCYGSNVEIYAPHFRFDARGGVHIAPMQRSDVLEILRQRDPNLHKILSQPSMIEYIPEGFVPTKDESYTTVTKSLGLETALSRQDVSTLESQSRQRWIIPDLETLSLFIQHGAELRAYAQANDIAREGDFYKRTRGVVVITWATLRNSPLRPDIRPNFFSTPFTTERIDKAYATGQMNNLGAMMSEVEAIREEINQLPAKYQDGDAAKAAIMKHLLKNSPELAYQK